MVDQGFLIQKIILAGGLCALALGGCATVNVPNIGQQGYQLADDERRLQKRADEFCETIDDSRYIYPDKGLENYLTGIANGILPETVRKDGVNIRVTVIKEPSLNAFALPNNRIFVHTGMLAAVENEAQLATLLGHEMTHINNRHSLKQMRSITNKAAFLSAIQAPVAAAGGSLGSIFTGLAVVSSVYGYSQELESEADDEGFKILLQQGYDISESPKLFEHLEQFIKDEDIKQPFFFSTHPHVAARTRNFERLIQKEAAKGVSSGKIEQKRYAQYTRQLVLDNAAMCLEFGMFKTAERLIEKFLGENPQNADAHYYRGELYRQRQDHEKRVKTRDKASDYPKAVESYDRAIEIKPDFAEAFKGKGRALQKQSDIPGAKEAFKKYLELRPQADDRGYIEQFLSKG